LREDEKLLHLERPLFWQASGSVLVLSGLASVGIIIVYIFFTKYVSLSTLLTLLVFPIVFGVSLYGYFRTRMSFVAFTDRRVLVKPVFGKRWTVDYAVLTEVKLETNYLQCRKELALRRFIKAEKRSKVTYIEGIARIEFYHTYLEQKLPVKVAQTDSAL